jgi:hypothetical protein
MNWNEAQLLSWRPRRVSNKLRQRLFAAGPPPLDTRWIWRGLVPATACALLTLMTVNRSNDSLGGGSRLNVALSNLNDGLLATADRQSARNHNDFVTFDSTNQSVFNSNTRFATATNFSNE